MSSTVETGLEIRPFHIDVPQEEPAMDVETLTGLLREAEEHHARYEPTAPPHQWSDFYAAYIVARDDGRPPEQADEEARRHVAAASG